MLIDDGLELLEEVDAWDLLHRGEIGRVGVTIGCLPAIFPVNYRVIDGDIVFRTAPGTKLEAATAGAVVAFEVDDFDERTRTGWSVLVVGTAEVAHGLASTRLVLDAGLEPFADGRRAAIVRIRPEVVTGRRIVH